jgi:hypothetical protein
MYIQRARLILAASTLTWAAIHLTGADQPQISILTIETDNVVTYVGDASDPAKLALTAGVTTPAATRAFTESITIGDVVKVNGKPAKGLWSSRGYAMGFSPTAAPGFAIADTQNGLGECRWEIQTADGKLVGRFVEGGLAPHQLTGGSGIFFGVQGQQTTVQTVTAARRASMTEDPSLRRSLGGGVLIHTFHVAPAYPPGDHTIGQYSGSGPAFPGFRAGHGRQPGASRGTADDSSHEPGIDCSQRRSGSRVRRAAIQLGERARGGSDQRPSGHCIQRFGLDGAGESLSGGLCGTANYVTRER